MSGEADERLPAGPRGEQGERGERGLSRLQGRAIVVLFLIAALSSASGWFWNAHEVNADTAHWRQALAAQQHQAAQEKAAQEKAAEIFEAKLCTSLNRLAALNPPPGNPASNPARAYAQQEHAVLAQLGPDVGCDNRR